MIRKLLYLCTDNIDPYHNLALEQYLTDTVPADTCILYLWQNRHTVVIGRNQNAWQECRTALLEQDGGKLSRRLSGGGAVYHDMGNLNFTFSLPTAEYDLHRQQRVIVEACRSLGIEASFSGRNDILAAGRKFSGNSFYHHNGCSFHNGTLLVSVDMANLGKYLTPSQRKLQSKGVASVPSRVVNLSELHPGLRISQMQQAMAQAFADVYGLPVTTITESQLDASEIEARRMRFASYDWIYGRAQPFPFSCGARYPWGEITLELQVEEGICRDAAVYTDSMDAEFAAPLAEALRGCRFRVADLCGRCGLHKPVKVVRGGSTRAQSVLAAALEANPKAGLLAVHDAARPLVDPAEFDEIIRLACRTNAAAPAVPVTDTIKAADPTDGRVLSTPDRSTLFAVYTPQVIEASLLKAALQSAIDAGAEITDDCSAVERLGKEVYLATGSRENIKITTPLDLLIAEAILRGRDR